MFTLISFVALAFSLASCAVADFIPEGAGAHFFTEEQNFGLVFGPEGGSAGPGVRLVMVEPGDGTFNDQTVFFPSFGSGVSGPLVVQDFCISSAGVEVDSATDALRFAECSPDQSDPSQIWFVDPNPHQPTISDANSNCFTLFQAELGAPVTLATCEGELLGVQEWDPVVVPLP
ncbi:hypothetical protein OH77DRAFT_1430147 [Trametes cingulata]|nr:hypothetical protein OH77DRAFT_1430147 [Trametes cingulata]